MDMTWTDARDFMTAAQTMRRQRLLDMAVAARGAGREKGLGAVGEGGQRMRISMFTDAPSSGVSKMA